MIVVNPITLSDSGMGDGTVMASRRFDRDNEFDAALWKFLFYWDLNQVKGLPRDEVDIMWMQHCGEK